LRYASGQTDVPTDRQTTVKQTNRHTDTLIARLYFAPPGGKVIIPMSDSVIMTTAIFRVRQVHVMNADSTPRGGVRQIKPAELTRAVSPPLTIDCHHPNPA